MEINADNIQGLETVFEAMPDALVLVNEDGKMALVNKQTELMFGYSKAELLGKTVEILLPQRFGESQELFGYRKNGEKFPVEISLSVLNFDNQLMSLTAVHDVTKHMKLHAQMRFKNEALIMQNQQIQAAMRMKSEFLANMSHELRTPLNGIMGFAELMHSGMVGEVSEEQKEYLGDILTSSQHLLHLINDVLDLAKVESGKMEFYPQIINIQVVVSEVCDILHMLITKKNIQVNLKVSPTLGKIIIDPAKLKQILYNFLSNAIKFSANHGVIEVSAEPKNDNFFKLSIKDHGVGIDTEDQARLFVEFQQLEMDDAKKCQGSGLGLVLTRRIAEAQGGSVGVSSEMGKGSTFYAILPRDHQV